MSRKRIAAESADPLDETEVATDVPRSQDSKLASVSERKLKANRENAKKSTGPKTLRGKTHSCRNALRHGLFARHPLDFALLGEDSQEYEELLSNLFDEYRPVGRAEELEVERIGLCWWRLNRVWRHENSVNRVAMRDVGSRELDRQEEYCKQLDTEEDAVILRLQKAIEEIKSTEEVPQDLNQIFATKPGLAELWSFFERIGMGELEKTLGSKMFQELGPEELSPIRAELAIVCSIKFLEYMRQFRTGGVREVATAQHVIPDREALDRILRYETAIERNLGRALDRLEHLQRRRRGETVPPLEKALH